MRQITAFRVSVSIKLQRFVFRAQFLKPSLKQVSRVLFLGLCLIVHLPSARALFSCLEVLEKDSFQRSVSGGSKAERKRKCAR